MAQLQYIGARYVPKWYQNSVDQTSNWEVNVEYEPLTWVTTQNNHLYLSKKTVPDNIGTPAQNTDYWLDMGVFTGGGYDELRADIDNITDNIIPPIQSDVSDLQGDVAALEKKTGAKKYIFISDSYGTGAGYATITPWIDRVVTILGLSADDYSSQPLNGACFGNNQFTSQLALGIADGVSKGWTADNDIVIVVGGGFNDREVSETDLRNAMTSFKNTAKATFPDAKICIAYIAGSSDITEKAKIMGAFFRYKNICSEMNFIFWQDIYPAIPFDNFLLPDPTDYIHPNNNGQERIAQLIVECLNAGQCSNTFLTTFNAKPFGNASAADIAGQLELSGDVVRIKMGGAASSLYTFSSPVNWTFNQFQALFDIAVGFRAIKAQTVPYNILVNSGTNWYNIAGYLLFTDYHIRFYPQEYGTMLNNIGSCYLPPFDLKTTRFNV